MRHTIVYIKKKVYSRNLPEVDLIGFILRKLSRTTQHSLDCARCEGMLPLHNKLMPIRRDQLHIHGIRPFTAAIYLLFGDCNTTS